MASFTAWPSLNLPSSSHTLAINDHHWAGLSPRGGAPGYFQRIPSNWVGVSEASRVFMLDCLVNDGYWWSILMVMWLISMVIIAINYSIVTSNQYSTSNVDVSIGMYQSWWFAWTTPSWCDLQPWSGAAGKDAIVVTIRMACHRGSRRQPQCSFGKDPKPAKNK